MGVVSPIFTIILEQMKTLNKKTKKKTASAITTAPLPEVVGEVTEVTLSTNGGFISQIGVRFHM